MSKRTVRYIAMNLLSRREHGIYELKQKLKRYDFSEHEIDEAVDRLVSQGLASDERFAESYTNSRMKKGFGPERITNELKQRHVADEWIQQALSQIDWQEQAKLVQQKKFANPPKTHEEKIKQQKFMFYRGFVGIDP